MGLGYIGLPTAIIAAKHGIQITGVDINPKVVEMTNLGKLHIIEPGMQALLQEVVSSGWLKASTTPDVSDAYFVVVPTPFKGNHEPDISYVETATRAVIPFLKEGDLYVIESTSPVGTTDKMADLIFDLRPELKDKLYIAYCPERVLPGNVIYELVHNDIPSFTNLKISQLFAHFVQKEFHTFHVVWVLLAKFDILLLQQPPRQAAHFPFRTDIRSGTHYDIHSILLSQTAKRSYIFLSGKIIPSFFRFMKIPEHIQANRIHTQCLAHFNTMFPIFFRDTRIMNLCRFYNKRFSIQQESILPHFKCALRRLRA